MTICGTLHITVRDDLKRTWSRITRLQRSGRCAHQADQRQIRADEVKSTADQSKNRRAL
jgi:hypothetical protein